MRTAIVSDIHGNAVAFDAVLSDLALKDIDQVICLGDAIQGGPEPRRVVTMLRDLGCPTVMGNADAWLLTGVETGSENISPERRVRLDTMRAWALESLSADDKAFIESFSPSVIIEAGGVSLLGFHGTPDSFDELLLPNDPQERFESVLSPYLPALMCGGHTHVQFIRRMRDGFFFNPGSVGVTYNHDQDESSFRLNPWAEYAVLSVENGHPSLEFRRVAIDVDAVLNAYETSGAPFAEAAAIQYGRSVRQTGK